jgi:hypothetical protein
MHRPLVFGFWARLRRVLSAVEGLRVGFGFGGFDRRGSGLEKLDRR